MATQNKITIGLFGFGVVGEGLYKILSTTPSLQASIKKVCIKNPGKKRNAPEDLFTNDKEALLNDAEINLIVEVIDDSVAAFEITERALKSGKDVITANKKMIAENLSLLLQLQKETGRSFLYEASACASIPIIRNLEEYYDNDLLHSISAIVNGSTNFILTKMFEENLDFKAALLLAQQLGFAESNPKLDVEGFDAANKSVELLLHAYGIVAKTNDILFNGIQNIVGSDATVASKNKQVIKLVSQSKKLTNGKIAHLVLPQFIDENDYLAFVKNEYNGVVLESSFADKQFFLGKGAGSFPTASAVLSDIAAIRYDYKYEYKKLYQHEPATLADHYYLKVYVSFDDIKYVPKENFLWIEEWHSEESRKYLVGVVAYKSLAKQDWWKTNGNSLILAPEPFVEDVELRDLKKRSLEVAGIFS